MKNLTLLRIFRKRFDCIHKRFLQNRSHDQENGRKDEQHGYIFKCTLPNDASEPLSQQVDRIRERQKRVQMLEEG